MKARISVKIQWRCQECGHHHKQVVMVTLQRGSNLAVPQDSEYPLVCAGCGCQGVLQVSFGGMTGIAVKTPEQSKAQIRHNSKPTYCLSNLVRSAKNPSLN